MKMICAAPGSGVAQIVDFSTTVANWSGRGEKSDFRAPERKKLLFAVRHHEECNVVLGCQ